MSQNYLLRPDQFNFLFYKHLSQKRKIKEKINMKIKIQKYAIIFKLNTWYMYIIVIIPIILITCT